MEAKLVSVNITTYNRAHLLPRCLDSVLSQSYQNLEIVIVDDCSTDDTDSIVKQYQQKDNRIKYIRHDENKKLSSARNTAIKNSNGFYIAFLDDDDEWIDRDKIAKQVEIFEKKNNIEIVCSGVNIIDSNRKIKRKHFEKPNNLFAHILKTNGIIHTSTVMTKKSIVEKVGGFDIRIPRGVDSDFYRNCIVKYGYDVYFMEDITANYYEYGSDRMSQTNSVKSIEDDILSNSICLSKYKTYFRKYPKERFCRKINIMKKYLKLFKMEKKFSYIVLACKVFVK